MRRLQHPQAPCLNVGTATRPIYLPTEVCKIAKGQRRLKLDERQTAEMIKVAAKKPRERAAFIEQAVTQRANFPEDPTVNAFGMRVVPRMMEVGLTCMTRQHLCIHMHNSTSPKLPSDMARKVTALDSMITRLCVHVDRDACSADQCQVAPSA